jgi:hypothetical protein
MVCIGLAIAGMAYTRISLTVFLRKGVHMAKLMITLKFAGAAPTIDELQARYGLADDEIDKSFGIVEVDPEDALYTILVEETAISKIKPNQEINVKGPYSNPRISPFGPPEAAPPKDDE